MSDFERLYMFNPFRIQNARSEEIAETYKNLQDQLVQDADTGFMIAKNIEIYANMNFLLGEMIARLQEEHDTLKTDISIMENKQIYMQRKQWQETNSEKAPAMSYFEAMAKEFVKEDLKNLAHIGSRLFRFKKAYESIESKQNALKKKLEAIKFEL
jgi:hypothetical protein